MSRASVPVKKLFTPSAASTPLLSWLKLTSRRRTLSAVDGQLPRVDGGGDPVDAVERRRQRVQRRVVAVQPVEVDLHQRAGHQAASLFCFTWTTKLPLFGVNFSPRLRVVQRDGRVVDGVAST